MSHTTVGADVPVRLNIQVLKGVASVPVCLSVKEKSLTTQS